MSGPWEGSYSGVQFLGGGKMHLQGAAGAVASRGF